MIIFILLYRLQVRVRQHEPLRALPLEIHLDLRMTALALQVQDHALAELAMPHALTEADAARRGIFLHGAALRHVNRPRHLDARAYFFEQLGGNLADEARRRAVTVDAVQAALLGIREEQLLHRARRADIAEAALFFEAFEVGNRARVREQAVFHTAEEHDRKLQPLRGVQRHHLHAVFPRVRLLFTGLQYRVRQEACERQSFRLGVGLVTARGADEFFQVLDSRFAAVAALLLEVREQAARVDDVIDLLVQRQGADLLVQLLDEQHEAVKVLAHAGAELLHARPRSLPHRARVGARVVANRVQRLRADATRRQVHDALERRVIGAAEDEAQVGQRIFDFRAFEEPQAAVHAIRYARRDQRFFE